NFLGCFVLVEGNLCIGEGGGRQKVALGVASS
ncbi:hypothetical protein L195_g063118, partial [Trifolium pratense]